MYTLPQQKIVRELFKNLRGVAPTHDEMVTIYNFDYNEFLAFKKLDALMTWEAYFGDPKQDYMGIESLACTIEDALAA
jgi:hypothetical protein